MKKSLKLTIGACSVAAVTAVVVPTAIILSTKKDNSLKAMGVKIQTSENAKVWFVSDGNNIFDNSFNELGLAAVANYGNTAGVTYNYHQPNASNLSEGYKYAIDNKAEIVVGTGEAHGKQAPQYFKDNTPFIGLDSSFTGLDVAGVQKDKLVSIQYNAQHAGYLAGLYALKYIQNHKHEFAPLKPGEKYRVATYGGQAIAPVTAWMDGFEMAVDLDVTDDIEMVYYNGSASIDDFSGGFNLDMTAGQAGAKALDITKRLISRGADIIFPVAGPQTEITINEIKRQGARVKVIGVDSDARTNYNSDLIIGSAIKDMNVDINDALKAFYAHTRTKWNSSYAGRIKVGSVNFISNERNDGWRNGNSDISIDAVTSSTTTHVFGSISKANNGGDWVTVTSKEL